MGHEGDCRGKQKGEETASTRPARKVRRDTEETPSTRSALRADLAQGASKRLPGNRLDACPNRTLVTTPARALRAGGPVRASCSWKTFQIPDSRLRTISPSKPPEGACSLERSSHGSRHVRWEMSQKRCGTGTRQEEGTNSRFPVEGNRITSNGAFLSSGGGSGSASVLPYPSAILHM